jgi:hypothetical protein
MNARSGGPLPAWLTLARRAPVSWSSRPDDSLHAGRANVPAP